MSNHKFQITKQSEISARIAESGFNAVDARNRQVVIGLGVKHFKVIGKPHPRLDGPDSVTGRATYTVDVALPAMLHAKLFRSTLPHAKIQRLDVSRARALTGVTAVLTAIGEMSVFGIAPAVANAIARATGVRIKELPMSAEKLFERLKETKER